MSLRSYSSILALTAAMALGVSACSSTPEGAAPAASSEATSASPAAASTGGSEATSEASTEASTSQSTAAQPSSPSDAGGDVTSVVTALDELLQPDPLIQDKAMEVAINKCLAEKGATVKVPAIVYTPETVAEFQQVARVISVLTAEKAAKWGYHPALITDANREYQAFMAQTGNVAPDQAPLVGECIAQATSLPELTRPAMQAFRQANPNNPAGEITPEINKDPRWVEVVGKWKSCMEPAGIALPSDPLKMPPAEKVGEWFDTSAGISLGEPKEEEIKVATMDANCRATLSFNTVARDVFNDVLAGHIDKHKAYYTALQEATQKDVSALRAYIEANQ